MTDKDFLLCIYARLKNVHMEDPHVDYMYKLYDIAEKQDTIAERRHDKAMMNGIRKEARELAAQCWCDPKTSHIEMNVDLADAVAYRIDRLLSQIADLRTEVAKNHAAWKVADEDCRNLTEKVIPNIRTELTEALAALLSALTLLLENKLGECSKQLADAKLRIKTLEHELTEARTALNEVQAWPYSETLEIVRFIWKEKHATALKAAQEEDDEHTAAIRARPWG